MRLRGRARVGVALATLATIVMVTGTSVATTAGATASAATPTRSSAAASSTPSCTIDGSSLPIVFGVSTGQKLTIACTGLPPLHPYLLMQTSLLLAIDPKAAPLLQGNVLSLSGLLALLNALPEINPGSFQFPFSDLNGDLNTTWTVPTSQPPDPNATCPPDTQQFNSGLLGCALATIDLTSFKPVTAGSFLMTYGNDFLPPSPTLAVSPTSASPGQTVTVSDAANASTYWWVQTLASLEALLGGGGASVTPSLRVGGKKVDASGISVAPPTYDGTTFTPPILSGSFTVPKGLKGKQKVALTLGTTLEGLPLDNFARTTLKIGK